MPLNLLFLLSPSLTPWSLENLCCNAGRWVEVELSSSGSPAEGFAAPRELAEAKEVFGGPRTNPPVSTWVSFGNQTRYGELCLTCT